MKQFILILLVLASIAVSVFGLPTSQNTKLCWLPNPDTQDTKGYKVYWSRTSNVYADTSSKDVLKPATGALIAGKVCVPLATTMGSPPKGRWYFVATAYDTADKETVFSNEPTDTWPLISWQGTLTLEP